MSDYLISFHMVEKVVAMTDVFPNSTITYRAISSPGLHHFAFIIIILMEALTGLFCLFGFFRMLLSLRQPAEEFNRSKNTAIIGLSLGFLGWQVLFMTIGGEWFGMWMSPIFVNAIQAAFQFFITYLGVLIYVIIKDSNL